MAVPIEDVPEVVEAQFSEALLQQVFQADFYQQQVGKKHAGASAEELFDHFLSNGIDRQIVPSPFFDVEYVKNRLLSEEDYTHTNVSECNWIREWLKLGSQGFVPCEEFDAVYYRDKYLHNIDSHKSDELDAFCHFLTNGLLLGYFPNEYTEIFHSKTEGFLELYQITLNDLYQCFPAGKALKIFRPEVQKAMKALFQVDLYRAQLPESFSVKTDEVAYRHFLTYGIINGIRPTVCFNEEYYTKNYSRYIQDKATDVSFPPISGNSFIHWFVVGLEEKISASPIFDSDYYWHSHKDLQKQSIFPLDHYILHGRKENFRRLSPFFHANVYFDSLLNSGVMASEHCSELFLDYVLRGQYLGLSTAPTLELSNSLFEASLKSSVVEEFAIRMTDKVDRLRRGELGKAVEQAASIEPQIFRPYTQRRYLFPPYMHPASRVNGIAKQVVKSLPDTSYDNIVLMPHCRMAGSGRVAGEFVEALKNIDDTGTILVISTELDVVENIDWFPENTAFFDVSQYCDGLAEEQKLNILLDVVRGISPRRIININSNLCWKLTTTYGKQLAEWMDIYVYLFTWDLDEKGNRGGYPIQWFLPTFDHVRGVFTDNITLRSELIDRYSLPECLSSKIQTCYTPVELPDSDLAGILSHRKELSGRKRCLWAGRFDRQKRFDIVVSIARSMPEVDFWIWGKKVLHDSRVDFSDVPDNVKFQGLYTHVDELPLAASDVFLYTAQWDGIPTVLLDIAARGVPIVASAVGGIGEILTAENACLVSDIESIEDYVEGINGVLNDFDFALSKAKKLKEEVATKFDKSLYKSSIENIIKAA